MYRNFLTIISLLAVSTGFAYNPFKGMPVDIYWEWQNEHAAEDSAIACGPVHNFFVEKSALVREFRSLPEWLENYHLKKGY